MKQFNANPSSHPGRIQNACTPMPNAHPTRPIVTHPDSLDADADKDATQGPSDLPARKYSSSLAPARREDHIPTPTTSRVYAANETVKSTIVP